MAAACQAGGVAIFSKPYLLKKRPRIAAFAILGRFLRKILPKVGRRNNEAMMSFLEGALYNCLLNSLKAWVIQEV
jgi:hypothetical protein